MFGLLRLLTTDECTHMLAELNISGENLKRCDLLHRSCLLGLFDCIVEENRKSLLKVIKKANVPGTHPIVRLKYIMLLHFLLMNSNSCYEVILDNPIRFGEPPQAKTTVRATSTKTIENVAVGANDTRRWVDQASRQYYSYLQKVCMHTEVYARTKRRPTLQDSPSELISEIYELINLMKSVFPLKEFILNFGRYFQQEYQIIADVNRIIASDLTRMYCYLAPGVERLYGDYRKRLSQAECKQLVNIIDEIYQLHEEVYIFLYNRYYFSYVEGASINWFKVETSDYDALKKFANRKNNEGIKNLTIDDIDLNQFERTYLALRKETRRGRRPSEELPDL